MALLGVFLFTIPVYANPGRGNPETKVSRYISSQLHRLALQGDQVAKMNSLLQATSASRRKIFDDVGVSLGRKASWVQLASLKYKIGQLAPKARARVKRVLTRKQLVIYDQIREEVRALLKKELM